MSLCPRTLKFLISNWPRARKFSQLFKNTGGEDLFYYALRPIFMLLQVKIWKVGSRSILKLVYFDSWSWQSLFQLVMLLTVFFHWMYKYIWGREPSVIHGWFVYWIFRWEMRRLSKSEIQFRIASFFFFYLARCVREFKSLLDSFQELHFDW